MYLTSKQAQALTLYLSQILSLQPIESTHLYSLGHIATNQPSLLAACCAAGRYCRPSIAVLALLLLLQIVLSPALAKIHMEQIYPHSQPGGWIQRIAQN